MIATTRSRQVAGAQRALTYWLLRNEAGSVLVLIVGKGGDCGSQRVLPVFSFEEEAQMFLRLRGLGSEWQVRPSGAGGLISLLHGLCRGAGEVALDPMPEMVSESSVGLVSMERERFMELVRERSRALTPRGPSLREV